MLDAMTRAAETWYIRHARVLDPADAAHPQGMVRPLLLRGGRIEPAGTEPPPDAQVIEAEGLTAVPGLVDLHVHLREPGGEEAETIETGTHAAAAGGFSCVVCMPNTTPPLDTPERILAVRAAAENIGHAEVRPAACLTCGRAGAALADLPALARAGAVCFTDDGSTVPGEVLMRKAMAAAARLGRVVMDHAQDPDAERRGVMHEGDASRRCGLPGIPAAAEARIIERDIRLAAETGCALHIQHLTSALGADLVRAARAEGLPVSAEVTPHHLMLCDDDVPAHDPNFKMNPPLRSAADRAALLDALLDGTAGCLATDHAPHAARAKARGFFDAPFGVVGLETAVGVTWTLLVRTGRLSPLEWLRLWTSGPARILGLPEPGLRPGGLAHVALLDVDSPWTVRPERFQSKSRNTCFAGRALYGRCRRMFHAGRPVWSAAE